MQNNSLLILQISVKNIYSTVIFFFPVFVYLTLELWTRTPDLVVPLQFIYLFHCTTSGINWTQCMNLSFTVQYVI